MKFVRYAWLFVLMVVRNLRWVMILIFCGQERPWRVLDFQMILCARKAGLDPKENSIHKQLILDHIRETKATEIMQQFIEPEDIILELGANIGYYVCIESKILSEQGHIYAVEPSPENVALLERTIALNGIQNIEIFNMAMSDRQGTAKLYQGQACNLHSLVGQSDRLEQNYVEVQTDSVDRFLEGKRPITFLRMDVEGYETVILQGMQNTLAHSSLTKLFIEIHPVLIEPDQMQVFFDQLEDSGFEIQAAVSRDNWQRTILGECRVEHISLTELAQDPRVRRREHAFEVFFKRT